MDATRTAPLVGIAACLAVVAVLAYPFLVVSAGVGAYYGTGAINPLAAGMLALVTAIALAAGRQGRSDPGLAAGVALAFGAFTLLIAAGWGLTARVDVVQVTALHRWALIAAAAVVPVAAAWYARALGML